jgi:predicted anti-sigma-YlaC factor YlaD
MRAIPPPSKRIVHPLLIDARIQSARFEIQGPAEYVGHRYSRGLLCAAAGGDLLPTAPFTRAILYVVLIGLTALPSILAGLDKVLAIFG